MSDVQTHHWGMNYLISISPLSNAAIGRSLSRSAILSVKNGQTISKNDVEVL